MRNLSMIARLYERITGTPYWTTRCVSAEFGPTPGAQYAQELAQFGDGTLMRLDQAEVLHTYQMWWFRLLHADRVVGIARSGVLAVVVTLLLIGCVAFLVCTGLARSGERGLRAGRLGLSGLAETRPRS